MKKVALIVMALMAILALAGTGLAATKITITGSTTVLPIAQKAAEVYMKKNSGVSISVAGTGSGDGIKAIIDGIADIGNSSRDVKKKEFKLAESKGKKIIPHAVALDCIVPVVHPTNTINDLTLDQIKGIYTGKIKNWKEVGGMDKKIVVISRDTSSGTYGVWKKKALSKARVRPDAQTTASNGQVAQAVAGNKYAIGYVGIGYLNAKLKGLTVGGVKASAKTAMDNSYPIARKLFMITVGEPQGEIKSFIDWIKSPEGQDLAEKEGFVKAY